MAYDVHIHLCFGCDDNDDIAVIAKKHRLILTDDSMDGCREAAWFLDELSTRTGENKGPKGGLLTWGMVGNYTDVERFVDVLKPFWADILSDHGEDYRGPLSFEHIIVFEEAEQSAFATAYEIFLEDTEDPSTLTVKKHELPFQWAQA